MKEAIQKLMNKIKMMFGEKTESKIQELRFDFDARVISQEKNIEEIRNRLNETKTPEVIIYNSTKPVIEFVASTKDKIISLENLKQKLDNVRFI